MSRWHKVVSSLLVVSMLVTGFAATAVAADQPAIEQEGATGVLTSATVSGTLTGGQFAKIWLGLQPQTIRENVTITAEWDRDNPGNNGVGFFVLNASGLQAVVNGGSLLSNNIGAGAPIANAPGNQQGTTFFADGASYTVVVFNDSATDANFTLSATNATFSDDSGQVRDPNATAEAAPADAAAEAPAAEAAPAATPAPAATTAPVTSTAATTATAAAPVATEAAPAAMAPGTPFVLRAEKVQGSLPNQNDQHFLALVPSERDGEITLTLSYDPQDSSELSRRLNFWVLDNAGFNAYVGGTNASEVAIAAGNRTFTGLSNERVATFNAAGLGPYTVIVYNNSQVPATYTLTARGATLEDDSMQTDTAKQQAPADGMAAAATATADTPAGTTAPAATSTTATTGTAAATTQPAAGGREGEPGGTYTVKAGDTLALIARDIYGDFQLYTGICSFNNIPDCARIEIGDVIKLPTREQLNAGAVAPAAPAAAATTAPAAAATPAATPAPAASATTAATATTTSTATTGTGAATTPAATPAATPTRAAAGTGSATGNSLVAVAEENGNFTILIKAIEAAGLADDLAGAGPFTVFAPTDAAFNALGAATVDALLKDTAKLRQVLLFHVVNGEVMSTDLEQGLEAKTLQGSSVGFTLSGATAKVQDSNIVVPDIAADNGVIHVIDKVMLPPTP